MSQDIKKHAHCNETGKGVPGYAITAAGVQLIQNYSHNDY